MKKAILFGMVVGSTAGSYLPVLWGGSLLSATSILFGAVGGFVGIWLGYKISSSMF